MQAYQSTKLAKLLHHCALNVPYYTNLFHDLGITHTEISPSNSFSVLSRIPVLDKRLIQSQPDSFVATNISKFGPRWLLTSGTTGTPLSICWDSGSNVLELLATLRLWSWAGFRPGKPLLDLRSRIITGEERNAVKEGEIIYLRQSIINAIEFSSDHIRENTVEAFYKILLRHTPQLVRGHPRAIHLFAETLHSKGLTGWKPRAVTTVGEAITPTQRARISQLWDVNIYDNYGLKEHNIFIAQCEQGGYHLFPEYGICEIVSPAGDKVQAGEQGRIIATGLHNYAQPLLRYDTRDLAVSKGDAQCQCGRTYPLIDQIIGRVDEALVTHDGQQIGGLSFAFFGLKGIVEAQIVQDKPGEADLFLVATSDFNAEQEDRLLRQLKLKCLHGVSFKLQQVQQLPIMGPGKFKLVVSRLKHHD